MLVGYAFAGCLAALSAIASAQDSGNSSDTDDYILDHVDTPWTFTDCAAPSEMESCWTAQNVTEDVFEDEQNCPHIEKRIQCALTNCWNRVYSCDYQQLIMSYNLTCLDSDKPKPLPFFPPPANAAGQCNCNLYNYMEAMVSLGYDAMTCGRDTRAAAGISEDGPDGDGLQYPGCNCCFYGVAAAAMYDVCPDTNPSILGLGTVFDMYVKGGDDGNGTLQQCADRLENYSCTDNGYSHYGKNATDYAKSTPLHSATGNLTDLSGIITSPVSGATFTWTGINSTYTITAASVEAMKTKSASATGSGSSKASGAATGATASSIGAAATMGLVQGPVAALMGLSGLAVALL